jgi:hypothetical protein
MISFPVAAWTALNALNCILAAGRKDGSAVGFSISLALAALSCGLLSAGAATAFLGLEGSAWALQMLIVLLALAVRPPATSSSDVNAIAVYSTIRFVLAVIVWRSV